MPAPAGVMAPEPSATDYPFVSPDRPDSEAPHFVAEMFFLTQVACSSFTDSQWK